MTDFKGLIASNIARITNIDESEIKSYIEVPQDVNMGDYAFPCFKIAKDLKKAPQQIANEIKDKFEINESEKSYFDRIEAVSGYLNVFINKSFYIDDVLNEVLLKGENYGKSSIGNGKTVVIDYSSPNIAKPFHIGHLRSTVIGNSLYKIYNFLGYKVIGINHLGDWGMGICRTIAGYLLWKDEYDFSVNPINSILAIYVRYN